LNNINSFFLQTKDVDNFYRKKKRIDLNEINENELISKNSLDEKLDYDQMHDDMRSNLCKSTRAPDFIRLFIGGDGDDEYLPTQTSPPSQPQAQSRNHYQSQRSNDDWQMTLTSRQAQNDKFNTQSNVSRFDPRQSSKNSHISRQQENIKRLEIKAMNIVQNKEKIDDEYILQFAQHFDQLKLNRHCLNEFLTYFQNRLNVSQAANRNMFIDTLCIKQEKF